MVKRVDAREQTGLARMEARGEGENGGVLSAVRREKDERARAKAGASVASVGAQAWGAWQAHLASST